MDNLPSNPQETNRWRFIPPSWKEDVDGSLLSVLSLNREFMGQLEDRVSNLSADPPRYFHENLASSWMNHNAFFASLGPYLLSLPSDGGITQGQAADIQEVLDDMNLVDQITLVHTLAIKPLLKRHTGQKVTPFNTFYIDYPLDHLRLLSGEITQDELVQKYHGGSSELFQQRINRGMLSRIFSGNSKDDERRELQRVKEKMFIEALYDGFIDRHPRIKALTRISTIDNFDEYRFLYNLEGIEGFFLKDYLIGAGLLRTRNGGVKGLLSYLTPLEVMATNAPAKQRQLREPPFYTQSTGTSCASTCAMVLSNLFFGEPVSKQKEGRFHSQMESEHLDGCPLSKVAYRMSELYGGLKMRLVHTTPALFNDQDVADLLQTRGIRALKEYRHFSRLANEGGVGVEVVRDPLDVAQETIDQGGIYMAATELDHGILHTELLLNRSGDNYRVYDPLRGTTYTLTRAELSRKTSTILGRWGVSFQVEKSQNSPNYQESIGWFRSKAKELNILIPTK